MRLLMLPKYDPAGASSRLRTYQYIDPLQAFGIDADVHPLLGDDYVADLYSYQVSPFKVARSYVRRLGKMLNSGGYDAIWIEKELLPWMPAWFERMALQRRPAIVVDYDDALFHRYDQHRSALVRTVFGKKIDAVMRNADLVTAGNGYLSARATDAGAGCVEWLPTVVDLTRYPPPLPRRPGAETVIGWIGSPSTAHYLQQIAPALRVLKERHPLRCIAIGARPDQVEGTPFESVVWSEDREVELLASIDIGVMPLVDEQWERGKCGYKLIQYMAVGCPVVASPVGVNPEIVDVGGNGYLAGTTEEWVSTLDHLIADPSLRSAMGREGRKRVETTYSLQAQAPRLAAMLHSLADPSGRRGG